MVPGGLQRFVLEDFRRQPAKWPQEASRGSFSSISGASPPNRPRKPAESRFKTFQTPARKVAPRGLQRVVLNAFRRGQAGACLQTLSVQLFDSRSFRDRQTPSGGLLGPLCGLAPEMLQTWGDPRTCAQKRASCLQTLSVQLFDSRTFRDRQTNV